MSRLYRSVPGPTFAGAGLTPEAKLLATMTFGEDRNWVCKDRFGKNITPLVSTDSDGIVIIPIKAKRYLHIVFDSYSAAVKWDEASATYKPITSGDTSLAAVINSNNRDEIYYLTYTAFSPTRKYADVELFGNHGWKAVGSSGQTLARGSGRPVYESASRIYDKTIKSIGFRPATLSTGTFASGATIEIYGY